MKIKHNYDIYGRTEPSVIYLVAPGKRIISAIDGIDTSSVNLDLNTNNTAELSFSVNRYVNNIQSNVYDDIEEMMELYCDGIWFKIIEPPSISNDGTQEIKDVTAESYEITLSQFALNDFKVNTGDKSSYEVMYKTTHKEQLIVQLKHKYEEDYKKSHPNASEAEIKNAVENYNAEDELENNMFFQIKFCYSQDEIKSDPTLEDLSLLHLILKHSGANELGWHIEYVDDITPDDENSEVKSYLSDYICNFDVTNKTVYSFFTQEVSSTCRCIFEFDTENLGIYVYRPETLGHNTNIFLSFRNIQNNISISRDDSLITQFYVDGLDGYNIDAVNIGNSLITDLSYFMKQPYMPQSLIEKYSAYLANKEQWRLKYKKNAKYQAILTDKLTELTNRVPVDTANTDYFSFAMKDLQSAYTSNVTILSGLENTYVDIENNFDISELKKHQSDWNLYESIKNYTIPAITAAIQYKIDNGIEAEEGSFIPVGTGNLIANPNPVILNTDWKIIGSNVNTENIVIEQIQDLYSNNETIFGITRGIQLLAKSADDYIGISQCKINVSTTDDYILSCYVRLIKSYSNDSGLSITYNTSGENDSNNRKFFKVTSTETWIRVSSKFRPENGIIDISFGATAADLEICGMQLELANNIDLPTSFGYYIQPDDSIKSYETDWKLYGIDELKVKISTYENCIATLKKSGFNNPYNVLSGNDEDYASKMHRNYLDYQQLLAQAEEALKERQSEYDQINSPKDGKLIEIDETDDDGNVILDENNNPCKIYVPGLNNLAQSQQDIIKCTELKSWGKSSKDIEGNLIGTEFTLKELIILQLLCRQASYSNENIITTSLTTPESSLKQQELLYQDAIKELYVESHPQYTYTDTVENIYALPEFRIYHDSLNVNDYIYLCPNDNVQKYIKLRVIKISYNPCDLDEQMTITFSNMVQYKSKTNDYDKLLNSVVNTSSYDGGSVQGISRNADSSSYVLSASVIQQFFSNPFFLSKMSGATSGSSGSSVNIDYIITQLLAANQDKFSNLNNQTGFIKQLYAQCLTTSWLIDKLQKQELFNMKITDAYAISTDIFTSTGNTNIGNLNTISTISESAADSIKSCHSHDEINTLQQQIELLQQEIDALKQPNNA